MKAKRKGAVPTRRLPRQGRSRASVAAILEAATQILVARGKAGLTTNRVAERAGVSIGTLYQYFEGKEDILIALARRLLAEDRAVVMEAVAKALADPAAELDRVAIRETIRRYAAQPAVRRMVMETMIGLGKLEEVGAPTQEVAALLGQHLPRGSLDADTWQIRLFVGSRAVEGAIRAAAYDAQPFFGTPEFEDTVVRMARGLLPELAPRCP